MAGMRDMEKMKMQHFHETMDRLTAASHVQIDYFAEHKKIDGYYESVTEGRFFNCDRLFKLDNMFSTIQLGYNPNRERVFLFATLKTSRYDTISSSYQKEMSEYQQKSLLKEENENRAYISRREENAAVLIEKKENKPWSAGSVKSYLMQTNMEAAKKSMPFFSREEEKKELNNVRTEQKKIRENISELRLKASKKEEHVEGEIRSLRKTAVDNIAKENLLEALIIRKSTAEKSFLRKINYVYDVQKKDIENYYREKRKTFEDRAESIDIEDDKPEDEGNE